jgi:8-oxo-dGTP pyrophosphatase MutT (NUDIX family)
MSKKCGMILEKNNTLLVVLQRNGKWSLPKGKRSEYEDELECATRETYEETGLNVKTRGATEFVRSGNAILFKPKKFTIKGVLKPIDTCEIKRAEWLTLEDIKSRDCNSILRGYIKKVQSI